MMHTDARFGDLTLRKGSRYRGIIVGIEGDSLTVFLENGLTVTESYRKFQPLKIRGGEATANFAEILLSPEAQMDRIGDAASKKFMRERGR